MNRSKCVKMTGLQFGNEKLPNGLRRYYLYAEDTPDQRYYEVDSSSEHEAAQKLHDMHWKDVRKIVIENAGHKCQDCSYRGGLDVHHVVKRGDSNNWDMSNLRALCRACHSRAHGLKAAVYVR